MVVEPAAEVDAAAVVDVGLDAPEDVPASLVTGSSTRITWAPKAASNLVAPAPASWPVKSQMRMCESAVEPAVGKGIGASYVNPNGGGSPYTDRS